MMSVNKKPYPIQMKVMYDKRNFHHLAISRKIRLSLSLKSSHSQIKHSGIIQFLVNPGDQGYIVALRSEMTVYQNNNYIAEMGIKDDVPVVVPIPPEKKS